jgi:glycosyltransferase involved in cell wall biosynthesis
VEEIVGCGVYLPQHQAYRRPPEAAAEQPPAAEPAAEPYRSHLTSRGAMFRRRHKLYGPFALYGGRIDAGKGCEELIEYFASYVEAGGDAALVLMGVKLMPIPEEPFVRFAGMLSERERLQALEAATVVVVPSPLESLSLLALESFAVGTPVLANARSEVLVDHCVKSNAGLYYADRDEFVECLKLLVADEGLRAAMGRNGRDYIRRHYRWDVVLNKYDRLIARVKGPRARQDDIHVIT